MFLHNQSFRLIGYFKLDVAQLLIIRNNDTLQLCHKNQKAPSNRRALDILSKKSLLK